jgi:hypothetical protein
MHTEILAGSLNLLESGNFELLFFAFLDIRNIQEYFK